MSAAVSALPKENFIYISDTTGAPYGNRSHSYVEERTEVICNQLVDNGVKAIVVACNTATNVGISHMRKTFSLPIVGVEPPIKPAVAYGGNILVLCTPLTAKQDKFNDLLGVYDNGKITVKTLPNTAALIEANFSDLDVLRPHVNDFLTEYENIDAVVLGCTHYYYLRRFINDYYGGRVKIFDSTNGVIKQLKKLLSDGNLLSQRTFLGHTEYFDI